MPKNDILTAMITMRLREDAAAAYRDKSPAERREIMQALRDKLDEILSLSAPISGGTMSAAGPSSASAPMSGGMSGPVAPTDEKKPDAGSVKPGPASRRRPPVPND